MGKLNGWEIIILVVPSIILYFLPTIVAFARSSSNKIPIFLLNFFLGWSFIGWIAALIWAFVKNNKYQHTVVVNNHNNSNSENKVNNHQSSANKENTPEDKIATLQKLKQLLDSGVLTQSEFDREKQKVLG